MKKSELPIIRKLRRLIEAGKAAKKARRDAEIALRFYLSERGGRVFAVCNGTAICEMPMTATVSSVSDTIGRMRAAALAYEELGNGKISNIRQNDNKHPNIRTK